MRGGIAQAHQQFGGDWTTEKLERVRKYLVAYAKIMQRQPFRFAYIDAFAGSGYRTLKQDETSAGLMFPELTESDSQRFIDGSARIALQVRPRFTKYIFVEKDIARFGDLQQLKEDYSEVRDDIILVNADANSYLQDMCRNRNWSRNRAVLFLDPFGMQVEWDTIASIAGTKAIDLWILFPLGVAVNRLLKKDGSINPQLRARLNGLFGTEDWYDAFYQSIRTTDLFGEYTSTEKVGSFDAIGAYFIDRLKTVFTKVADNPLPLYNSRNNPLYLLCFAAGNPKGSAVAVKIAREILGG